MCREQRDAVLEALRLGVHREVARAAAGVSKKTFAAWMATTFRQEVERAEQEGLAGVLKTLEASRAGRAWLASRRRLSRRLPPLEQRLQPLPSPSRK